MNISIVHKRSVLLACIIAGVIFHLHWMICLAFADDASLQAPEIRILIRANNVVTQDRIVLGDIAQVKADAFLAGAIKDIEIGSSPKPESIKALEKRRIIHKIQSQDYLPENMVVECPDTVYVKRPGQQLSQQQIEAFLSRELEKLLGQGRFRLEKLSVRGLEAYPTGEFSFAVDPEDLAGKNGRIAGFMNVYVNSIQVDRLNISADIAVYEDILFANRTISRNEILNADDFYEKTVNIYDYSYQTVRHKKVVEGKILQMSLRKDQAVRADHLSDPPLVKKGDMITLVASLGNLKIITRGVSKEDGYENDLIKVENFQSGKLVRGVVKEKSKVEVVY